MSPRSKRLRKVINPPLIKGFKPYGPEAGKEKKEAVNLHFEEYEALRLCDYDMYNHHEASGIMGVSRPTFTRIYSSARQKIALAFVEGRQIAIEGGKVYFDSDWYHCTSCKCFFNNPEKEHKVENCPLCGSNLVSEAESETEVSTAEMKADECADFCVCPQCGYEQPHRHGKPCSHHVCPSCNVHLKRSSSPNSQQFRQRAGKKH
jgi:uncharacterized protein